MAYLGVPPQSGFITTAKQRITSSTNNYVDLDHSISSLADVIVWVNFVKQSYTNLTLTTSSRITLGATLVASDIVEIAYLGKAVATQTPSSGTVTNDMLSGSIANSKLANSSITLNGSAVSLGGSASVGGTNSANFHVRKSSNQTGLSSGGWTKVTFDDEVFDSDNAFASDKFTAPSDGKYFFTAAAKINDSSSSPTLVGSGMRFTINGAIAAEEIHFMANGSNKAEGKSVTAVLNLTASQYVEVYAYAQDNGGSACSITGGTDRDTFFMGFKLIT